MSQNITEHLTALENMKKYPKELFYKGDLALLNRPKVSIVGSRRLSNYTREYTYQLSRAVIYNNKLYSILINGTINYEKI